MGFRSLAGVTLNLDSAATIRAKLGNTRERRIGTARGPYTSWCYAPSGPTAHALLELMSDAGDLGTPGHALNVIRLRAGVPASERDGCAPLGASAQLETDGGLRLGLGATRIRQLLGEPARYTADSLVYEFVAREFIPPESPEYKLWNTLEYRESCFDAGPPFANVGASVIVVLRDDKAVEVRLERYDRSVC